MLESEVNIWRAYQRKHGSLDRGRKIELGNAITAATIAQSHGLKLTHQDFMPSVQSRKAQEAISNAPKGMSANDARLLQKLRGSNG